MKESQTPKETLKEACSDVGFDPIIEVSDESFTVRDHQGTLIGEVTKSYIRRTSYSVFREELRDQYRRSQE